MAKSTITKYLSLHGNIANTYNILLKKFKELDYVKTSSSFPSKIEFSRGQGGLFAKNLTDVKTVLNVSLEEESDDVNIILEWVLAVPSSYINKKDNELEREFSKLEQELVSQSETEKVCEECNTPIQIDDKFCRNCGNPFKTQIETTEPSHMPEADAPLGTPVVETIEKPLVNQENVHLIKKQLTESAETDEQEIQELLESERQLKNQLSRYKRDNKTKEQFYLDLSEDMTNDLAILDKLFHGLLHDPSISLNKAHTDDLTDLRTKFKALLRISSYLSDIQKIELNTFSLIKNNYSLSPIIKRSISNLNLELKQNGITVNTFLDDSLSCNCDKTRIEQVITNLIINSIDFCNKENSEIEITLSLENQNAKIVVMDDGMGIQKESQDKIFDKFYQDEQPEFRTHSEGGLGLPVCKGIIENHGGKIWAQSKGMNIGTEIHILLPLNTAETKTHETIRKVD